MTAFQPMLTVKDVARRLQVSTTHVKSLIERFHLIAVDVSLHREKNKRYRVTEEAFDLFLQCHRVDVLYPQRRRRRTPERPPPHDWTRSFPDAKLLTPKEAGARLKISAEHVLQITASNHIRYINLNGENAWPRKVRIREDDLCDFIMRVTTNPTRPWHKEIPVTKEVQDWFAGEPQERPKYRRRDPAEKRHY